MAESITAAGQAPTQLQVSVVIPAKDEQDNIGILVDEISAALTGTCSFEVVLVDDGSSDATFDRFQQALVRNQCRGQAIRHDNSTGQSTAIYTAMLHARGRYIVTIDGDGQNDPADIPALVAMVSGISNPHFCIAGYRKNRQDTSWKKFQSRIANRFRAALLDDGVPDTGCGLKLLPRATFLRLPYFDHMHRFIPALIRRMGGDVRVVVVNHRQRQAGVSKYTAWNRLWVGLVDLCGVIWLKRRSHIPNVTKVEIVNEPVSETVA